jgi:hypothetical protein
MLVLRACKHVDLITPSVPVGPTRACEQLDVRASAVVFDAGVSFIRLARMLAHRSEDDFADIFGDALAIAATTE